MTPIPVSITMLVKNAERHLEACLAALAAFDEIIVLDNGSTDRTLDIARRFPNVAVHHHDFIGFGPMKNLAAGLARNDWVLNIDSDEILPPEQVEAIRALDWGDSGKIYALPRLNHYRGRPIKSCGWYPDWVKRLYHRQTVRFNDNQVHESLIEPAGSSVVRLPEKHPLLHYSFDGTAALISKMQHYTDLFAAQQQFKRRASVLGAVGHGAAAFFKNYILKRGMFDGGDGWTIAFANASGAYYKYIKLHEANQRLTVSLIITTYNRPDALEAVLRSVLAQRVLPQEVIVADDGSRDDTRAVVERYRAQFPVPLLHAWQPDDGFRLAESRNRALAQAGSDYIVIIDGDMVLHPEFIADHKHAAKKGLFVQGSRVILTPEKTNELLANPSSYRVLKWYEKGLEKRFEKRFSACRLPWFSQRILRRETRDDFHGIRGCNMAFFREDALKINGFNSDFVGWGREDSEFVARFFNNGGQRANLKFAAVAYHLYHPEAERAALPENDRLLAAAQEQKLVWCENGVDRFLPAE